MSLLVPLLLLLAVLFIFKALYSKVFGPPAQTKGDRKAEQYDEEEPDSRFTP